MEATYPLPRSLALSSGFSYAQIALRDTRKALKYSRRSTVKHARGLRRPFSSSLAILAYPSLLSRLPHSFSFYFLPRSPPFSPRTPDHPQMNLSASNFDRSIDSPTLRSNDWHARVRSVFDRLLPSIPTSLVDFDLDTLDR